MLGLFKLKKKSKKDKEQHQDDEKENTSSPTKVKKVDSSKSKESSKESKQLTNKYTDENNNSNNTKNQNGNNVEVKNHSRDNNESNQNKNKESTHRSLRQKQQEEQQKLTIDTQQLSDKNQQSSPLSSKSETTNVQHVQPRAPVLSASDAYHQSSFIRGTYLSSTISGSDLHRFINSGYLNGDSYLSRGVDVKTPKSPHFHRPPNFSYSRNTPNYVTPHRANKRGAMRTLLTSASSSDTARISRNFINARGRSISPTHVQQQKIITETKVDENGEQTQKTTITTTIPVNRDLDNEEPIRLSKFSGGYVPNPDKPPKIESLDWPAPPYPAAVPELRARSRSSSNRRAPSTINTINAENDNADVTINQNNDDSDSDINDAEVKQVLTNNIEITNTSNLNRQSGACSVSSSIARIKASRPNSKLRYQNKLFDNEYDDYLLKYRYDKDWRKLLDKNNNQTTEYSDVNTNQNDTLNDTDECEESIVDGNTSAPEANQSADDPKLRREIEYISKIEHESSMAAALLGELKAHQKVVSRKLKLDPWKASRTPSANAEPLVRTRYDSPVNASPSRIFNHNKSLFSSNTSGNIPTTSGSHLSDTSQLNNTTNQSLNTLASSSTIIASPVSINADQHNKSCTLPSNPSATAQSTPYFSNRNTYISSSSRVISSSSIPKAVPKPGYGLTPPKKSVTLPNSSKYNGLSSNQSANFVTASYEPLTSENIKFSDELTSKLNKYYKPNSIYYYYDSNATRSIPNLHLPNKVYPYDLLKVNRKKKLPFDVNRHHLEYHLSDNEFNEIFGMQRTQFYELSEWKRILLKKQVKLF